MNKREGVSSRKMEIEKVVLHRKVRTTSATLCREKGWCGATVHSTSVFQNPRDCDDVTKRQRKKEKRKGKKKRPTPLRGQKRRLKDKG